MEQWHFTSDFTSGSEKAAFAAFKLLNLMAPEVGLEPTTP